MQQFSTVRIALFLTLGFVVQNPVLAEDDYPAAYFKPYIVYQAPEVIATNAPTEQQSAAPETAPAASAAEPKAADRYPAAYYEPVIVFQDKDLIEAQAASQTAAEAAPAPKPAGPAKKKPSTAAAAPASEKGGVPVGALLLIAGIAGGLYWVINKNKEAAPTAAPSEPEAAQADAAPAAEDVSEEAAEGNS
jgi:hypothetical protein